MAKKHRIESEEAGGAVEFAAVNKQTGEQGDLAVLEENNVAFDPTRMALDLTKAEKRRTTALMMAIQAYDHLIIKDAEYLREAHAQARSNGSVIRPATMDAMVHAAIQCLTRSSLGASMLSAPVLRETVSLNLARWKSHRPPTR